MCVAWLFRDNLIVTLIKLIGMNGIDLCIWFSLLHSIWIVINEYNFENRAINVCVCVPIKYRTLNRDQITNSVSYWRIWFSRIWTLNIYCIFAFQFFFNTTPCSPMFRLTLLWNSGVYVEFYTFSLFFAVCMCVRWTLRFRMCRSRIYSMPLST